MYGWTRTRQLAALVLASGLLSLLPACKQAEGERCQIDDDCVTGLYCEYGGNTKTIGGYCVDPNAEVRSYGEKAKYSMDEVCTTAFDGECEVRPMFDPGMGP